MLHLEAQSCFYLPQKVMNFQSWLIQFVILREVLFEFFGDFALKAHFVKRQLILSRRALHDSREEGLRVEKPCQPDSGGQHKIRAPRL
jgi:hypothetical protein